MRKLLALIVLAAAAVLLGGCYCGTYGFSYGSGYSCPPAYYHHGPVYGFGYHHGGHGHHHGHCH